MTFIKNIEKIYEILLEEYSYQGWWHLINFKGNNPTKTGSIKDIIQKIIVSLKMIKKSLK
jgi:endonuclease III-like uncharacterized protein